jgi:hypothetical protein
LAQIGFALFSTHHSELAACSWLGLSGSGLLLNPSEVHATGFVIQYQTIHSEFASPLMFPASESLGGLSLDGALGSQSSLGSQMGSELSAGYF